MENLNKLIERDYELDRGNLKLGLYLKDINEGPMEHKYSLVIETTKHNDGESITSKIVEILDEYFMHIDKEKKSICIPSQREILCHPDGTYFDVFYNTEKTNALSTNEEDVNKKYLNQELADILNNIENIRNNSYGYDIRDINIEYLKLYKKLKENKLMNIKENPDTTSLAFVSDRYNDITSRYQNEDVLMTCELDYGYDDAMEAESDGYCKGYYKTTVTFPAYFISDEYGNAKNIWEFENGKLYYLLIEELGWIGYATGEIESSALKHFGIKHNSVNA